MITLRKLMEIHVETLFTHDDGGRLVSINEPGGDPAPRFFIGMTKDANVLRFRYDLPNNVVSRLLDLCSQEPIPTNLREKPNNFEAFREVLKAHVEIERVWTGPAYRIPNQTEAPSNVVRITAENSELLSFGFRDTIPEIEFRQPITAAVDNGRAVSICHSVRISPMAHEAGVHTLEGCRRKGYATDVVTGWALAVEQLGHIPLYSTSWSNIASQGVARRLGAVLFGVDLHFT